MSHAVEEPAGDPGVPKPGGSSNMELGTCQELLHRLRELEAENSALAQANENQRETYERCLDEVANHVVQALLNQKDLREECIKLKRRVFDLERQNQTLSTLFQQKLQLSAGSLPQLPLHPLQSMSEPLATTLLSAEEGPAVLLPVGPCTGQKEVGCEQQQQQQALGSLGPPLDALSPFLKKKAQILEVLRSLEETDPLLLHPTTASWRAAGQCPQGEPSIHPDCSLKGKAGEKWSPGERLGSPEPVNGEVSPPPLPEPAPWASCLLLGPSGLGGLLRWEPILGSPRGEEKLGRLWGMGREPQRSPAPQPGLHSGPGSSSSSSSDEAGEPGEALTPAALLNALARKQLNLGQLLEDTESYLQAFLSGAGGPNSGDTPPTYGPGSGQPPLPNEGLPQSLRPKGLPKTAWGGGGSESLKPGLSTTSEGSGALPFLSVFVDGGDTSPVPWPSYPHSSSQVKSELQISPSSPIENQELTFSSPPKSLNFLKLSLAPDKTSSPSTPHLSPQLPRSSRIPCWNGGPDGSPSPMLTHRGLGGELSPEIVVQRQSTSSPPTIIVDSIQLRPTHPTPSSGLSPEPQACSTPHRYEDVLDLSTGSFGGPSPDPPLTSLQSPNYPQLVPETLEQAPRGPPSPCPPQLCPYGGTQGKGSEKAGPESPQAGWKGTGGSSKKPSNGAGRRPGEPGFTPLRDRLTALGKLKTGSEGAPSTDKNGSPGKPGLERARLPGRLREGTADTAPSSFRPPEPTEAKVPPRGPVPLGTSSLKQQDHGSPGEPGARCYSSHSMGARLDLDPISPRGCLTKVELAKSRLAGALCPQTPRTPVKLPTTVPSPGKPNKSPHGSPTKLPSKSPTKVVPRGGSPQVPKDLVKPEKGKGPPWADCGAPSQPVPKVVGPGGQGHGSDGPELHSAIEEKVMKGIEENVLRLQGQDRTPSAEAKHRNSSSIVSWFGLKKSKLPALSRRADPGKNKESLGGSPLGKGGKQEARKLETESLNISKLMAKAEDLRKALEEEKAYLSRQGRGRSGGPARSTSSSEVVLGQAQSQLTIMYQGADTFMQQLLNRVDGKELPPDSWQEPKPEFGDFQSSIPETKGPQPLRSPRNGLVGQSANKSSGKKSSELAQREAAPTEDGLAEPIPTPNFTACGSLTRTLDSGIGTFPPPDHSSTGAPSKNPPKPKPSRLDPSPAEHLARPNPLTKVPRRARTLDREVPAVEELLVGGRHPSVPAFHALLSPTPRHHGHKACTDDSSGHPGRPPPIQLSKNWTFPNTRAGGNSSDPFLCPPHQLEGLPRTPLIPPVERKQCLEGGPPPPTTSGPAFSGSRTPSTSDMGEDGRASGGGPPGLETSESLSDSLYDSLSSCGSQG
ncbi:nck-associated protein 5-like isoform X1 [Trichosurus vulpecula]|uniref:nck-associated protein 5-like isoform X1 n=1 Tax=Trichosurus vulpecula TaxID=9337 RepID=UPI00186ADB29|nr:nck-associated protein 5-like isoform X1 [Trichosurus vulpecula]XP_036617546.1 nck-associated protein 5-like isoform X1 [Trichosurus vulpecula]